LSQRRDTTEAVRAATDIVEVVSGYIPLKRKGNSFSACCPFHQEKTPSFNVSQTRQFFKCFGCNVAGDVFHFVMKMEKIEFVEALRVLADRAGIRLELGVSGEGRGPLLEAHKVAQELFRAHYLGIDGLAAREYVLKRGIRTETAESWGLGLSASAWTGLVEAAGARGISADVLEKSGLALPGSNQPGHYDRFRGRLMFPIADSMGRIVAFGARSLDGSEPKYLNSPETALFSKGRMLYGLDRLRHHPRTEPVLVMEGYTDVIMSTQAGVRGCVATLGTALTTQHAKILARYSDRIILLYDGDKAGLTAAERGCRLLLEAGHLDIQVVVLPGGEDPCDFFARRGDAGLPELLQLARSLTSYLLERTAARHDIASEAGKLRAARELITVAEAIPEAVAREIFLGAISEKLGIRPEALAQSMRVPQAPAPANGPEVPTWQAAAPPRGGGSVTMLWLCQAILNEPTLAGELTAEDVELVSSPLVRSVLMEWRLCAERGRLSTVAFLECLQDEKQRHLAQRALLPDDHGLDLAAMKRDAIGRLSRDRASSETLKLRGAAAEDPAALEEFLRRQRLSKGRPGAGGA
jgi:DNA primase